MPTKFTQSITKQEAFNYLEHLLYEGEISIDCYGKLVDNVRSLDENRGINVEILTDEQVLILIK